MIEVASDYEGLRQAALALLEEDRLLISTTAKEGEDVDLPERELSDGYYVRARYRMATGEQVRQGMIRDLSDLEMTESRGLGAIAAARNEFDRDHPPCPGCGNALETPYAKRCWACEWKKEAA